MLGLLFSDPYSFILTLGSLILAIGLHEAAHCYMADRLGDPTPRSMGRLTLNPIAHLDPLGTLSIVLTGMFGWGKSAPFDPYNLRNPNRDIRLIALAGPATNLLLAIIGAIIFHLIPTPTPVANIIVMFMALNINLALFNLLPIPPLDGSKIFFPKTATQPRNYQTTYILLVILIMTGIVGQIISPISQTILHLLLG